MKKLLIMCGAGHATSTVVRTKIESWLSNEGLADKVTIKQSSIGDEEQNIAENKYDIVVSTTQVSDSIVDQVINGVSLLTGIGANVVFDQIKKKIEE